MSGEMVHLVHSVSEEGNSNASSDTKEIRCKQAKRWCFTLNNYTEDEMVHLDHFFNTFGCEWIWGEEVGDGNGVEKGTPHLQGYVEFPKRVRPVETVKCPRVHWIRCKGNRASNVTYCTKDGCNIRGNLPYDKPLKLIGRAMFYPWQEELVQLIEEEPDDRTIYWIWESGGCRGKTSLAKWLCVHKRAMMAGGKANDIKHMVVKWKESTGVWPQIVIWNVTRSQEDYVSYESIEAIKDGLFFSGKYEGGQVVMNSPHIVCFANFEPDTFKMSEDRWNIREI